jgi:hypothetical protein
MRIRFLVFALAGMAFGILFYVFYPGFEIYKPIPVVRLVLTNGPPFGFSATLPTNGWMAEVPFDSKNDPVISDADISTIKKLGIFRGWWPHHIKKIVIISNDWVWVEYPTRPGTIRHHVSIIKDVGGWTVWSEEELKDKDFGVERR